MADPQTCRLCGSPDLADFGAIPDSDYFAGRVLPHRLAGGRLYGCSSCGSMFRHPAMSASSYMELYEQGNPTQWDSKSARHDLSVIRSMITSDPRLSSVLDVGCGTGEFLHSLPQHLKKYGVEPSAATDHAESRGIEIVARQIELLPSRAQFSAITIIDVIEHVVDPASLLTQAYAHLAPGGKIIISTGDPANFYWRHVFKSRFWYASFPEHITFPSVEFCRNWCERHGAVMVTKLAIRYQSLTITRIAINFLIQAMFYVSPRTISAVGRIAGRVLAWPPPLRQTFAPGIPGLFRDHQVLVLQKPQA